MASNKLMGVEEAAGVLGLHPKTVRKLIRDGRLDAARVGRQWRITSEALDRFLHASPAEKRSGAASAQAPVSGARSIRVSAVVNIEAVDREKDLRISTYIQAALLSNDADRGETRYDHIYYPDERRSQLIFWGNPQFVSTVLRLVAQLADAFDLQ